VMICSHQLTSLSWFPAIISVAYLRDLVPMLEATAAIRVKVPTGSSLDIPGFSMVSISR
jgi:hypothetical protein